MLAVSRLAHCLTRASSSLVEGVVWSRVGSVSGGALVSTNRNPSQITVGSQPTGNVCVAAPPQPQSPAGADDDQSPSDEPQPPPQLHAVDGERGRVATGRLGCSS